MHFRTGLALVAALSAMACASNPPGPYPGETEYVGETEYDCDETLTTPLGVFGAVGWHLFWFVNTDDGQHVQLGYRINLEPEAGEKLTRFTGLGGDTEFLISFDERDLGMNWFTGQGETRIAEARIGDTVIRSDVTNSLSVNFNWAPTQELFRHEGDLHIALQTKEGRVLQTATVTRQRLLVVEETLRELENRYAANLADKEHRCRLIPKRYIIVT